MLTLGFDSWDRGLARQGHRSHKKFRDYHLYPKPADRHAHADYNRNAFLDINHEWSTYDNGGYVHSGRPIPADSNGHWSNFVKADGYGVVSDSRRNSDRYGNRNQERRSYSGPSYPQAGASNHVTRKSESKFHLL